MDGAAQFGMAQVVSVERTVKLSRMIAGCNLTRETSGNG
jgi:hypothetical protein